LYRIISQEKGFTYFCREQLRRNKVKNPKQITAQGP
jgi:hypothetical protein